MNVPRPMCRRTRPCDSRSRYAFTTVARLTFKYPLHFASPAGARERYGSDVLYEQALVVGQALPEGRVALLPSTRPAADNLAAILPGTGRYLAVARR